MIKAKRDELRKTILIEETKGFSGFPVRIEVLEFLLNRTDKCDELEAKCMVYEEALTMIKNPIECPACSIDDAPENVPCYCFEDFNNPRVLAKEAIEKANACLDCTVDYECYQCYSIRVGEEK